ncbi:MAG: PBP1A family penicillin-binding protein [Nitriliruptorales bacterium]|nr:PBP1A family penicillin-binding protein [Nitriliruptorales bacterium]
MNGSAGWSGVKGRLLSAASAVGLATRAHRQVPPLFPGLRLPNVTDAVAERIATSVVERSGREQEQPVDQPPAAVKDPPQPVDQPPAPPVKDPPQPVHQPSAPPVKVPPQPVHQPSAPPVKVPPQPVTPERQAVGRAAARLAFLSLGTVLGIGTVALVAVVLSRPAVSNAKALLDVELDIPEEASLPELDERSTIYDGDGNLLAVIDREVSRQTIALRRIPEHVRQAVITAEDRKFYEHEGYDVEGIGRALVANLQAGSVTEGGSTITQQLAKSEVGNERTLERKASELLYAMALEERFSKEELLERYLNQVYFGSRAYGIAAAAEEFFHTKPRNLNVTQAALLASLIRSPNSADPRDKVDLAMRRRNAVLQGMVEEGYIKAKRLPKLLKKPLGVKESSLRRTRRVPHVIDAVRREVLRTKQLGKSRKARERLFYYGGLRITTTLDLEMQRTASNTIRDYMPGTEPTAAIATVDPKTGAVKAIASGLGYKELEYDLPTQGRRQPGSAFKPFVYAAALQDGYPVEMKLSGRSPAYFEGVPGWERDCNTDDKDVCGVSNYGGSSYGDLDMREALKNSVNTAAAQLTLTLGAKRVAKLAGKMNIDIKAATNGQSTNSIGLGGLDQGVTALEMASAYAVFANSGKRVEPHLIAKVENRAGEVLYKAKPKATKVLDPVVDHALVDLMRGVVTGGTGTAAALPSWEVAGKTGTTQNHVDAWFVGYTPVLSTAVWVGHAKGQIEMPGMTGGALPASMWNSYMAKVLDGRKVVNFPEPDFNALASRLGDRSVRVPDVVRMMEEEALTALGKRKLIGEVRQVSSSAPQGTVVWQSPNPGDTGHPGETVYIGVSTGYVPPPPPPPSSSSSGSSEKKSNDKPAEEEPAPEEDTGDSGGGGGGRGGGDGGGRGGGGGGGGD